MEKIDTVEVKEIAKIFNERIIVDRISFSVREGEIFGLLGSNGSGKTTTFNMLSGLLKPSSGEIKILGNDISKNERFKLDIGFVTQQDSFYSTLTVRENLEFFATQFKVRQSDMGTRIDEILKQIKLSPKADSLAANLSGGMKKRLNIGCSLIHNPKIVFLDEPTVGLDPIIRKEIWELIKKLRSEKTVIITSHYMEEVEHLCDRVAIMFAGRIVAVGTPSELKERYKLKQMEDVFAHLIGKGSE